MVTSSAAADAIAAAMIPTTVAAGAAWDAILYFGSYLSCAAAVRIVCAIFSRGYLFSAAAAAQAKAKVAAAIPVANSPREKESVLFSKRRRPAVLFFCISTAFLRFGYHNRRATSPKQLDV